MPITPSTESLRLDRCVVRRRHMAARNWLLGHWLMLVITALASTEAQQIAGTTLCDVVACDDVSIQAINFPGERIFGTLPSHSSHPRPPHPRAEVMADAVRQNYRYSNLETCE